MVVALVASHVTTIGVARAQTPPAPAGPVIDHQAVGCVVAGKFPRFQATFEPPDPALHGRVRFRPDGGQHWYSVAMMREGASFVGVIPKPTKKLKKLDYYIEVTGAEFVTARTEEYSPDVVSGLGACEGGKIVATALPAASVLLEGPPGAAAIPAGFSAAGVTTAGAGGAATATTAGGAGGGGGLSTTALVAGGAAVAAGVGVAAAAKGSEDPPNPRETDDDGDGFTEAQGDCNDADAALNPGRSSMDVAADLEDPNPAQPCMDIPGTVSVTIHNVSCQTLNVDARYFATASGACCALPGIDYNDTFLVAPGATTSRIVIMPGFSTSCCPVQKCCTLSCVIAGTLAVSTELGTRTFNHSFNQSGDCPQCPGSTAPGFGTPVRLHW